MNEELEEIFMICDNMFENATIDFNELKLKNIQTDFFNDQISPFGIFFILYTSPFRISKT